MPLKKGYNTKGRSVVTEYLKENRGKTVSAANIFAAVKKSGAAVSESTVYRCLSRLEKERKIMKYVSEKGESAVYQYIGEETDCRGHLHLKCLSCGRVYHLDCGFMEELSRHRYSDHGFDISCEGSIIYGVCKNCR